MAALHHAASFGGRFGRALPSEREARHLGAACSTVVRMCFSISLQAEIDVARQHGVAQLEVLVAPARAGMDHGQPV
jgi:hypothetical protein